MGARPAARPSATPRTPTWRLVVAVLLVGLASAYLVSSLESPWRNFQASAYVLGAAGFMALLLGTAGTLALSVAYHVLLVRDIGPHDASGLRIASAYATGQIVRYVPGKIFGVMFQVDALRDCVRPASVLAALLVQSVHDFAWTLAFCGTLVCVLLLRNPWPLLALLPALAALHAVHASGISFRLIRGLPLLGRHLPPADARQHTASAPRAIAMTLAQSTVWLPMLAGAWFAFVPLFGVDGSLMAALLYIAAAVVSLLAVVVPSGLVVREAAYVWLGGLAALPADKLLFAAVATRLAMTAAELLVAVAAGAMARFDRPQGEPHG